MNNRNKRAAKSKVRQNKSSQKNYCPKQPPQINLPKFRQTFRFSGTNINGIQVSDTAIQGWLAANTTTASSTAYTSVIQSYRIKRLRIWLMNSASVYSEVGIDWATDNPSYSSSSRRDHANKFGSSDPTVLQSKPPPLSYQSSWISNPQNYLMLTFIASAGTFLIDVDLEYMLVDNLNQGNSITLGTARTYGTRAGQLVYLAMNWAYASASWLTPVGVSNSP